VFGSGANAYSKVSLETDVIGADPHRLVEILFDGALKCIHRAQGAIAGNDIRERNRHLHKAVQIVDEGLRAAVDTKADPALAGRLISLYQFVAMRLLQANLRADARALQEAEEILVKLRTAWAQIAPGKRQGAAVAAEAPAGLPVAPAAGLSARLLHAYSE